MSFEKLSERLHVLQEANTQLKELIDRLTNLKFQPGSVPLDDDEDNVKNEMLAEIHQTIREQNEDLESLAQECQDYGKKLRQGEERRRTDELIRGVQRTILELRSLEAAARTAQRLAQKKLQEARKQEREILTQTYQQADLAPRSAQSSPLPGAGVLPRGPQAQMFSREDKLLGATSNVTAALRRTHQMMADELSKSQYAQEQLDESGAVLDQLAEKYSAIDTLLANSKNLLGTLLRSQKSDTWYLETAFWVLSITIAWLVFRRLIYGPAWWLVWFPLKWVFRAWVGVLSAMGVLGGKGVEVRASDGSGGGDTAVLEKRVKVTMSGTDAPIITAGQDSRRASRKETKNPNDEENLSDQVGRIVDGEQEDEYYEDEDDEPTDAQRNPKKRMWEEEMEEPRRRDEL